MQVGSAEFVHPPFPSFNFRFSSTQYAEIPDKFDLDFGAKLKLSDDSKDVDSQEEELRRGVEESNNSVGGGCDDDEVDEEEEEEEEEFSFVCTNNGGSPISADDVFQDGQIRPMFPLFNRDLLFARSSESAGDLLPPVKKLFVEESERVASPPGTEDPEGPYCEWSRRGKAAVEATPEVCKKSNSTGFSRLRRFRELVLRSNSDGKDAFVFLHPNGHTQSSTTTVVKTKTTDAKATSSGNQMENKKKKVVKKGKSSALEKHFVESRAMKEGHKRKSYLPYRVGFFTSVNGLSNNVHPF